MYWCLVSGFDLSAENLPPSKQRLQKRSRELPMTLYFRQVAADTLIQTFIVLLIDHPALLDLRRVVLAQMQGSGRGNLGAYNSKDYADLEDFLISNPMKDGDAWLEKLLRKNEMIGEIGFDP